MAALAMLAAGCGDDGFDRDTAVADVVQTWGVDRPIAECMVEQLVDEYGEDRLADARQPTGREVDVLDAARPVCETREQWIELIRETAGDRATAACIFDTSVAEFGAETVTGGAATEEQSARLAEITEDCRRGA